jgi:elongation factor 2
MIERIMETMKDPIRIRNVATSSHVHHGKCVSGDTLIFLENKTLFARELFEIAKKEGILKKKGREEIYEFIKPLSVLTYKDGVISRETITYAWKIENSDKLIEIETKDGRRVKVTPEHKFLVFKNGKIEEKEAGYLKKGEFLVLPTLIPSTSLNLGELKSLFMEKLSEDYSFLIYLQDRLRKRLHRKIIEYGREKIWKEIGSKIKMLSFYHGVWKGRYRIADLVKIAKKFGIDLSQIYDETEFISYRKGIKRYGSRTSVKLKLPKSEKEFIDFFYLIGLLFGDGSVNITFDNNNPTLVRKVIQISQEILKINPTLKKYGNKCPRVYLNGGFTLRFLLNRIFEYPLKSKAKTLKVPTILFNISFPLLSSFIKGYFDTDGSVHQTVYISSASRKVLEGLQLLLLKFGCRSYIREKTIGLNGKKFNEFILNISGRRDLDKFLKFVGFDVDYKQSKLEEIYSKASFSKVFDLKMPFINMAENHVTFLPIANIRKVTSEKFVYDFTVEATHNFLANGFFIHNTTLTDNLMAGAGMLAEEMAGKVMYTWFDEQERRRQLTIYGANVSMVHEYEGKDYLINLVDTPGHVDFGGDVTRAMRAVDGTIVLVDAVESIMPQTETVFRQALREYVKPVLFINKTDRLIKELKLSPEQMKQKFEEIIRDVNILIQKYAPPEFKDKWLVNVADGSVAFGSAYKRWAISIPYMQKTGITFKDIIELTLQGKEDELAKRAPLHQVVLDMIIKHLPNPLEAQKYRLQKIWKGDLNSEIGKQMLACDANGKLAAIVTKVVPDPHVGFVATVRIFSGKVFKGKDVYLIGQHKQQKIQQVAVYKGILRIPVEEVTAGNIAAVVGIPDAFTGETVCEPDAIIEPFEEIRHLFEPVVTKAIEPKNAMDLPKLVDVLKRIGREDAVLQVKINQETGEYLVSGLGELHLEAKVENKLKELGIDVEMSKPIVVYRETVFGKSPEIEGKSPNKHNRFFIVVEPLEDGVYKAMLDGEIPSEEEFKGKHTEMFKKISNYGMDYDEAKNIIVIHNKNVLIDMTKGIQFMNEVIEMVKEAFRNVMDEGPLAREPCTKIKVKLIDAELHEDPVHRGPGQIIPAVRHAIREGILYAEPTLLEPKQIIRIDVPSELIGEVIREIENRRGQILDMKEERGASIVIAKMPVSDMFGFDSSLKSATSGRGFYSLVETVFEKLPSDLRDSVIIEIRKRKGLPEQVPKPET